MLQWAMVENNTSKQVATGKSKWNHVQTED